MKQPKMYRATRNVWDGFDGAQPAHVSASWLASQLQNPSLRIVDVCLLPRESRPLVLLPHAIRVDWEAMFLDGPGIRPSPLVFAAVMSRLGIGDDNIIVTYDEGSGIRALAVYRWLRRFGHTKTFTLQGGRAEWVNQQLPLTRTQESYAVSSFTVRISEQKPTSTIGMSESSHKQPGRRTESRRRAA